MMEGAVIAPANEAELAAAVRSAKVPLRIAGGSTRLDFGRPVQAAETLSTRNLSGITLYEPAEMVIGARAGTPLAEIEAVLAEKGQMLAFEPPDWRGIFDSAGKPTIGAIAAGNLSGSRRLWGGAARDSLIGVTFVNGAGEIIRAGGRVMKNVTGLDLVKLQAGAWGTLGVLTEVIFKVVPKPETAATLVIDGLDDHMATRAMIAAVTSPFEITGAAHDPARQKTFLRIEGFGFSVDYRAGEIGKRMDAFGPVRRLEEADGEQIWRAIRDAAPLAEPRDQALWRLSVKPSDAAGAVAAIRATHAIRTLYDWGGGLIWLATEAAGDAGASAIRAAARKAGGHATLVRAPGAIRAAIPVVEPEAPALAALGRRIKASIDPAGLFNPGLLTLGV